MTLVGFLAMVGAVAAGKRLLPHLYHFVVMTNARRKLYSYAASQGLTPEQADLWWGATYWEGMYNPAGLWYRITRPRGGRHRG